MSSARVRAQNKILSKLGASKPSKNIQFEVANGNFEKAVSGIVDLEGAMRSFILSLRSFHMSAIVLMNSIESIAITPDNSSELKRFASEMRSGFMTTDMQLSSQMIKNYEQRVLRPANGWINRAHALKHQVVAFNDEKLIFDHYTRKVLAMREARDKRAASGKPEKSKDVDKLVRNEQKLAAATSSYSKISDNTIAGLREFVNTREETLMPLLHRLLEFRVTYAQLINDEARKMKPLLKEETLFEGVMSQLESAVANFTGLSFGEQECKGAPNSQQSTMQQNEVPTAEPPVHKLSFESFVGEPAPALSPTTGTSNTQSEPPSDTSTRDQFSFTEDFGSPSGLHKQFAQTGQVVSHPPLAIPVASAPSSSFGGLEDISSATSASSALSAGPSAVRPLPMASPVASPLTSPLTSPVTSPTSPKSPWDDFDELSKAPPRPPPLQSLSSPQSPSFGQFNTVASPTSGWGGFDNLTFQPTSPSSFGTLGSPGQVQRQAPNTTSNTSSFGMF